MGKKQEVRWLPEWVGNDPNIQWLAKRDLAFRASVWSATESQYRQHLRRLAFRLKSQVENS